MDKVITVFGSAFPTEEEYKIAYKVGEKIGLKGLSLCNGGYFGTMEATARGCVEMGGKTIGVTVKEFGSTTPNSFIKENIIAENLFERLKILLEKGDAYVVLPGNTGTLVELSLVWEYYNKGVSDKIIIVHHFWRDVVKSIEHKKEIFFDLPRERDEFFEIVNSGKMFVVKDILKGVNLLCDYLKKEGKYPLS